jgi:hypothetical protein
MAGDILAATYATVTPLPAFLSLAPTDGVDTGARAYWDRVSVARRRPAAAAAAGGGRAPVAPPAPPPGPPPATQREAVQAAVAWLVSIQPDSLLARGYRRRTVSGAHAATAFWTPAPPPGGAAGGDLENYALNPAVDDLCRKPWRDLAVVIGED